MEPVRVPESRHAGRLGAFKQSAGRRGRGRRITRGSSPARSRRSSCAAPRNRSPPIFRRRRSRSSTASWRAPQRKQYDELRDLLSRVACWESSTSAASSARQMQILEALLRLRQAACHPGLIDREQAGEKSAKLTRSSNAWTKCVAGRSQGAGVLAVHQLLGIVRSATSTTRSIRYEYLDGRTRDRQARRPLPERTPTVRCS